MISGKASCFRCEKPFTVTFENNVICEKCNKEIEKLLREGDKK